MRHPHHRAKRFTPSSGRHGLFCATMLAAVLSLAGPARADSAPTVWIEAELFDQQGGWVVDSQFIDQMGSSFLLARGWDHQPVDDAETKVTLPAAATYTLWVRCRDWLPKHTPGRFQVLIDGRASKVTFGQQGKGAWTWVSGGTFDLSAGEHRVTLRDLTGHYGRCDALVLSADGAFTPPAGGQELTRVRRRISGIGQIVKDGGSYDVVVVGGGVAGTCAAVASARHGARTVLIQDRPVLGGNASDEIRVWVQGAVGGGLPNARESGLVEEILEGARGEESESDSMLQLARAEPNLTLMLLTRATKAICGKKGHIDAVETVHVITGERAKIRGRFFIDCTGDGVIGASAGAIYRVGREGRDEFQETIAPAEPDRRTLGSSLLWGIGHADKPVSYEAPEWAESFPSCQDLPNRRHDKPRDGHWWVEFGGGEPREGMRDMVSNPKQLDTIQDAEVIRDHLLRALYGVWDHCKNHPKHKKAYSKVTLEWVGYVAGKRESRRLIGDHIMTEADVIAARLFPDRVAYGGWSIDLHPPAGIYDPGRPSEHHYLKKPYSIPLRCLYSKNIDNLLFAGRNISVSHVALGTTRVMATCGVMGQAVGTAAAMCVEHDATPRQIRKQHIGALQQRLLKDDCTIIEMRNRDPADLARTAKVSASSVQLLETTKPRLENAGTHPMRCPRGQMFRVTADRIDAIRVYIKSGNEKPTSLRMALRAAKEFRDFSSRKDLAVAAAVVPAKHDGWVRFEFNQDVTAGGHYWFYLPPAKGLELHLMQAAPFGCQRVYHGAGRWHQSAGHYAFITEPPISQRRAWGAENVVDGVARPVGSEPHYWASDPREDLPQWVEFDLGQARRIEEVRLTFNCNIHLRYVPREPVEEMVRDYRILVDRGDGWREVHVERGNGSRHRVHRFTPVTARRVRIEVLATHGGQSAHIFEVRIYGPAEKV